MRKALGCLLLIGVLGLVRAQEARPWWYDLEQGKRYFRDGAYGEALTAFEEARRNREAMYTRMERDFIELLSVPEVRRLGDSLEQVEAYIAGRNRYEAAAALDELFYRVPKESLGGSVRRALGSFDRLKKYPDAEYWIGEVYRVEGEPAIALRQYERALEQRDLLESPGFDVEIRYKIADMYRLGQNYPEMEKQLLEIIKNDALWSGDTRSVTRNAMLRTLENNGIGRFLTLYRYTNPVAERAHRRLGLFYYTSGRHSRAAEHLMFSFLIGTSALIDEVLKHQFDYTFTGLDELMGETARRPALSAYLEDVEYYKTIYYLGGALYGSGKLRPARECWTFLSRRSAAGLWRSRAELQLRSPFVENPQEYRE